MPECIGSNNLRWEEVLVKPGYKPNRTIGEHDKGYDAISRTLGRQRVQPVCLG